MGMSHAQTTDGKKSEQSSILSMFILQSMLSGQATNDENFNNHVQNLADLGVPTTSNENGDVKLDFSQKWDNAYDNVREQAAPRIRNYTGAGATGETAELLDFIGDQESNGHYDIVHGKSQNHLEAYSAEHFDGRELNELTVGEVLEWQKANIQDGVAYTAAGKYQIINKTLKGLVSEYDVPLDAKFDNQLQDKLALGLLERRGLTKFLNGNIGLNEFQDNIAYEWASLKNSDGHGQYDNDEAGNFAHANGAKLNETLAGIKEQAPSFLPS